MCVLQVPHIAPGEKITTSHQLLDTKGCYEITITTSHRQLLDDEGLLRDHYNITSSTAR